QRRAGVVRGAGGAPHGPPGLRSGRSAHHPPLALRQSPRVEGVFVAVRGAGSERASTRRFDDHHSSRLLEPVGLERVGGESTHILVEPQLLARVAAEALDLNPDRVTLPPVYGLSDPAVQAAMLALDAELRAGGPGGHLLAESLGNVLAVHLLRRFSASKPTDVHPAGVLPRHKLRAVIEYIHEHLDAE